MKEDERKAQEQMVGQCGGWHQREGTVDGGSV